MGMLGMLDMRLLCPAGGSGLSSRPQFVTWWEEIVGGDGDQGDGVCSAVSPGSSHCYLDPLPQPHWVIKWSQSITRVTLILTL